VFVSLSMSLRAAHPCSNSLVCVSAAFLLQQKFALWTLIVAQCLSIHLPICPSVCLSATAWVTRMYAALRVASHIDYRLVCLSRVGFLTQNTERRTKTSKLVWTFPRAGVTERCVNFHFTRSTVKGRGCAVRCGRVRTDGRTPCRHWAGDVFACQTSVIQCGVMFVVRVLAGECRTALGMNSGEIPDSAITASSSFDPLSVGPTSARSAHW